MKRKNYGLLLAALLLFQAQYLTAQVRSVEAIGITVTDLDRSVKFYTEVLKFQLVSEKEMAGEEVESLFNVFGARIRVATLKLGEERIELTDYLTPGGRKIPEDAKSNDLIFQHIAIVVSDMDSAYRWLRQNHVQQVSTGPQTLPPSIPEAAGVKAFYFQDPDGHNLEVIYFPSDKGQTKWHQPKGKLFLGIDHTAIGVRHSGSSHLFYQQLLGLEKKGESWNHGTEQEHLNNVEKASLHISGYRSAAGPGVEFLEYLQPGPGREFPAETRSDDIWSWYTIMKVEDVNSFFALCQRSDVRIISKGITEIKADSRSVFKGFLIRDKDGHAILVKQ